jgi:BirA family biotin operon repressor/biotin-[acetyl-CoA-carboxylase] ligase
MIRHIHLDTCDSTQDVLKEQLSQFPGENILVSCEEQTNGRGRSEKVWSPMPGSLYLSFTIAPSVVPSFTAIELSVLVTKFFEGSNLELKWPNDVYNKDHKKCAGILVQTTQQKMLAGIGLNLFSTLDDYGGVFNQPFTCDKKSWCHELATFINENRFRKIEELKKVWNSKCYHLNDTVRIQDGKDSVVGRFIGLGEYGEALIQNDEGIHKVFNGSLRLFNPLLEELY